MKKALGLIEVIGLTAAMTALDAATKTADVTLAASERVIGVEKEISLTLCIEGDVAAVQAAVYAAAAATEKVGRIISARVIASPHDEMKRILSRFSH